jgi:hypothetical protein
VVVALRFVSRWKLENGFKADDYIMIAIVVWINPTGYSASSTNSISHRSFPFLIRA